MKKFPLILDVETKFTFREYDDPKQLGITVAAIYDYSNEEKKVFLEKELNRLFPILENASYIIGYNNKSFDMPVLQAYYPGNINNFPTFDILVNIKEKIGRRLALNDVVSPTLGKKKSGHGLMAIDYYKQGRWEELKKYCLDDVMLTKELFDFGVKKGEIFYLDERGKAVIKVDWKQYLEGVPGNDVHSVLPF